MGRGGRTRFAEGSGRAAPSRCPSRRSDRGAFITRLRDGPSASSGLESRKRSASTVPGQRSATRTTMIGLRADPPGLPVGGYSLWWRRDLRPPGALRARGRRAARRATRSSSPTSSSARLPLTPGGAAGRKAPSSIPPPMRVRSRSRTRASRRQTLPPRARAVMELASPAPSSARAVGRGGARLSETPEPGAAIGRPRALPLRAPASPQHRVGVALKPSCSRDPEVERSARCSRRRRSLDVRVGCARAAVEAALIVRAQPPRSRGGEGEAGPPNCDGPPSHRLSARTNVNGAPPGADRVSSGEPHVRGRGLLRCRRRGPPPPRALARQATKQIVLRPSCFGRLAPPPTSRATT